MEERNTTGSAAAGLMDRMKESATSQLGAQKDRATDGLGSVAQAVRQSTQQLRDQQHETIAQYVEQAADQIERFATRLKDRNVGDLAREAQDLARRRPVLFIGSAFALGLLGARFLKSSADNARTSSRTSAGAAYGDGGYVGGGGYGGWPAETSRVTDSGRL
jgi:exonuclease VII large subunit